MTSLRFRVARLGRYASDSELSEVHVAATPPQQAEMAQRRCTVTPLPCCTPLEQARVLSDCGRGASAGVVALAVVVAVRWHRQP
ncbi:hypothetical protein AK812_SmicGene43254 [Symbiodinium microadriaticum]|uniref:Uncharacterized protein n=1 Tax=Symbiodinium microadriaticum TaxID=2951 RepID=A0A1Q9C1I8_SYMMI|nr:hypothetical protein AK812_SmicGene43254 [Symbiodinium microadriaticum]